MYHWRWELKGKKIVEDKRHSIVFKIYRPNSCNLSEGMAILHVLNVSHQDLGQYRCTLLKGNLTLGEEDVVLTEMSKIMAYDCN